MWVRSTVPWAARVPGTKVLVLYRWSKRIKHQNTAQLTHSQWPIEINFRAKPLHHLIGGLPLFSVLWLILLLADTLSLLGLEQSPRRPRGSPMRKLRRGYARFVDLRDSHLLEPGSVLYNPSVGRILVLDNAEIAVMENNLCPFQPTFRLHIFSDSEPGLRYAQVRACTVSSFLVKASISSFVKWVYSTKDTN